MSGEIRDVDDETFDEFLEENEQAVVDFWATWCGPCKMVEPTIKELAEDYRGKISFAKVNVEKNSNIANRYGIQSIPAFLFIKNGEIVDQAKGALPRDEFEDKFKDVFEI